MQTLEWKQTNCSLCYIWHFSQLSFSKSEGQKEQSEVRRRDTTCSRVVSFCDQDPGAKNGSILYLRLFSGLLGNVNVLLVLWILSSCSYVFVLCPLCFYHLSVVYLSSSVCLSVYHQCADLQEWSDWWDWWVLTKTALAFSSMWLKVRRVSS